MALVFPRIDTIGHTIIESSHVEQCMFADESAWISAARPARRRPAASRAAANRGIGDTKSTSRPRRVASLKRLEKLKDRMPKPGHGRSERCPRPPSAVDAGPTGDVRTHHLISQPSTSDLSCNGASLHDIAQIAADARGDSP